MTDLRTTFEGGLSSTAVPQKVQVQLHCKMQYLPYSTATGATLLPSGERTPILDRLEEYVWFRHEDGFSRLWQAAHGAKAPSFRHMRALRHTCCGHVVM